jgi:5-methylcytosine-specific restriction endonuclease McrA
MKGTRFIRKVTNTIKRVVAHQFEYKCAMCQVLLPPTWECDHIIPLWKFVHETEDHSQDSTLEFIDPNSLNNLQPLCPDCHRSKTLAETLEREQLKYAAHQSKTNHKSKTSQKCKTPRPPRSIEHIECEICGVRYSPYFTHDC